MADAGEVPNQYLLLLNMSIPKYDKEGNKVESLSEIREREFLARFGSRKTEIRNASTIGNRCNALTGIYLNSDALSDMGGKTYLGEVYWVWNGKSKCGRIRGCLYSKIKTNDISNAGSV